MRLVKEHKLEVKLYGKHEVDDIVRRFPIWCTKAWDNEFYKMGSQNLNDEQLWDKFKGFLEKQLKLQKLEAERDSA